MFRETGLYFITRKDEVILQLKVFFSKGRGVLLDGFKYTILRYMAADKLCITGVPTGWLPVRLCMYDSIWWKTHRQQVNGICVEFVIMTHHSDTLIWCICSSSSSSSSSSCSSKFIFQPYTIRDHNITHNPIFTRMKPDDTLLVVAREAEEYVF